MPIIDLLKLMSLSSKKELINTQYFHMLYDIINQRGDTYEAYLFNCVNYYCYNCH